MPELPEVEVTRRGIAAPLNGQSVVGVIARVPALRYPLPADLGQLLAGRHLARTSRAAENTCCSISAMATC
jgi:formamidopyrimidine-DNA glycosylase